MLIPTRSSQQHRRHEPVLHRCLLRNSRHRTSTTCLPRVLCLFSGITTRITEPRSLIVHSQNLASPTSVGAMVIPFYSVASGTGFTLLLSTLLFYVAQHLAFQGSIHCRAVHDDLAGLFKRRSPALFRGITFHVTYQSPRSFVPRRFDRVSDTAGHLRNQTPTTLNVNRTA